MIEVVVADVYPAWPGKGDLASLMPCRRRGVSPKKINPPATVCNETSFVTPSLVLAGSSFKENKFTGGTNDKNSFFAGTSINFGRWCGAQ